MYFGGYQGAIRVEERCEQRSVYMSCTMCVFFAMFVID
jgi:hypothetical protein